MLFIFIILGIAFLYVYTYFGQQLLTPREAKKFIQLGKISAIVDVRTGPEYRAGHYPGAIHIPSSNITQQTTTGLPKRGILVYCNTGQRARYGAERLEKLGFRDVYYIGGSYKSIM